MGWGRQGGERGGERRRGRRGEEAKRGTQGGVSSSLEGSGEMNVVERI